ncbi:ATP-binding protein [Streptomyces sp. NPDC058855]|uniref:ATP-binding protein n=1 Tax=Streptomyces sp. NPDC058855 TaxID=3346651 RepID=UPI0036CD6467
MISEPSRYYAVELHALPSRIGQIRRIVSAHLRHWHLDALVEQAALGVTELLSNVHRHAEPDKRCTVELELLLDRLTVSVRDNDPRIPEPIGFATGSTVGAGLPPTTTGRFAGLDGFEELATSGRGLAIVGAVSESWGVRPCGADGKVVWFTLTAPAAPTPSRARAEAAQDPGSPLAESPFVSYGRFPGVPLSTPAAPLSSPQDPARTPAAVR